MNLHINYYQVLGIEKDSDSTAVKKSYYKLSKTHHPDKGGDATVFNKINEAYEILSDEKTRTEYDKKSKFGANYDELSELLNYEFDNFSKAWKEDAYEDFKKKEVLHVVVRVDDTFDGTLEYERWVLCKKCDGSGKDLTSKIQIKDSSGKVIKTFDATDGCDFCEGSGLDYYGNKCGFCFGQGKIGSQDCTGCKGEKRILARQRLKGIVFPTDKNEIKIDLMGNYSKDAPGKVGHLWILRNITR